MAKGLDIGSMFVTAADQSRDIPISFERSIVFDVESSDMVDKKINQEETLHIRKDDMIYIVGDRSLAFASEFDGKIRRPMAQGTISAEENSAIPMLKLFIEQALSQPNQADEKVAFVSPAGAVDSNISQVYHKGTIQRLLEDMGYDADPITEGMATIHSEFEANDLTGLAINFGAGTTSVCLAYDGTPSVEFSIAWGGDWIDEQVAQATGTPVHEVISTKEEEFELLSQTQGGVEGALGIYYEKLVESILEKIADEIGEKDIEQKEDVPVVVTGGTTAPEGFEGLFERCFDEADISLPISDIQYADRPLHTAARGALNASISREGEDSASEVSLRMDSQQNRNNMNSDDTNASREEIREQFENRVDRIGGTTSEPKVQKSGSDGSGETKKSLPVEDAIDGEQTTDLGSEPTEAPLPDGQTTPETTESDALSSSTNESPNYADSRPTNEPSTIPSPPPVGLPARKTEYDKIEPLTPNRSPHKLTQVYRARHPDVDRSVVLKGIFDRRTIRDDDSQIILSEARTWQRFADADHVVTLLSANDSSESPLLVMEYMDGGALTDRIGELSIEQALWTGLCIIHGVYSAHRVGVQHLDIKPSNILFRSVDGGWDVPKVADWGTSRTVTETDISQTFTPRYAAPEQHLNKYPSLADRHDLDHAQFRGDATEIDQYQIGLVLYELLTREFPYDTADYSAADVKFEQEPRPPSELVDSLPPSIDGPLMKALHTKPWGRYSELVMLMEELARVYDSIVERDILAEKIKYEGLTVSE